MRTFIKAGIWTGAAVLSVLLSVLVFLPAAWLAPLAENATNGRITLGDAQGSLWRGSAFIGAAPSGKDAVMPLLPGRFNWRLTPLVLIGRVDARLENPQVLSEPVSIRGNWHEWTITASSMALPAERLAALGAPLNTLQPSGKLRLSWAQLTLARQADGVDCYGDMMLDMLTMTTRLTPLTPLGSYRLKLNWQGRRAGMTLQTLNGALVLAGNGSIDQDHFQFSGTAQAAAGQEETLAGLLGFLGQPRWVDGKKIIGLEFKS
ncbi:type II secretion system protein N [Glaciimonas sp. PCH181]|uniref:type II secretion system protein N n=1 Tax=Glaciimonas sp. PCH181 TaxID=2133943 RepID=UPI000D336DCA|nr:type II secretion system protein N [Glaciimonas sp. PCH181]PUA20205.1 general secretion pathway protein GspN [Glaciimonas sp. PCH181]